jgi:multiple sugar transport system permease protein
VCVIWRWIYNHEYGLLNYGLGLLNLPKQSWLESTQLAMPSLILMSVWKNFGYNMVIFLAGLQAIPEQLYEAAKIDGAGKLQIFWYVTFPSLAPTTFFVVLMTLIGSFQFFAEPYIMTKGGPMDSTVSIVMYMYAQGFKYLRMGYASALAYVLFGMIFLVTLFQMWMRKIEKEM